MNRILIVDPSDRGGIAAASAAIGSALTSIGERPELLANRGLPHGPEPYRVWRWLPAAPWGRPVDAGPAYVSRRLAEWLGSAAALEALVRFRRPSVIDFQAPFNQYLDAPFVRHISRLAPVVWTVHDPLPLGGDQRELERLAKIYKAADLVAVHSDRAAEVVKETAGIEAAVVELPVSIPNASADRIEARRRLGLAEEGRILGALGFIRSYKGYDLLAEVWESLGTDAPRLLIMGELVDKQESPVLDRLNGTGRVDLRIGYASDEELELAFSACDAVLLPHAVASPSGLLAMAGHLGIPVISSDAPELVATVERTGAGRALPRSAEHWAAAVVGELPPPPPRPGVADPGPDHLAAYERARVAWHRKTAERRRRRPWRSST